jgi:outer membrane protein
MQKKNSTFVFYILKTIIKINMKNELSIVNILLILAVAFLLMDKFISSGKGSTATSTASANAVIPEGSIVYINTDSLLANYDFFKDEAAKLEQKGKEAEAALQARGQALQREFAQAQSRVQTGTLTPRQVQEEEQRLMQKQQSLAAEQERLSQGLLADQQALQGIIQTKLKGILTEIRKEKGYTYVLNYAIGTGVLMVDPSLDITTTVVEQLNNKEN